MMGGTEPPTGDVQQAWIVGPAQAGGRLDRFLADQVPELSRVHLQRLIAEGAVRRNGSVESRSALRLVVGDRVDAWIPPAAPKLALLPAAEIPLTVLHADAAVIVVDKAVGLVIHPARGHAGDTLVNALLARYPDLASAFDGERPGIVHRLDKDTSGVMVVARTPEALASLQRQFKDRSVDKLYGVLVRGTPAEPEGIIDAPIGRDEAGLKRMRTQPLPHGVPAQTRYRVLESAGGYSWVEVRLMTGRTHQIRVHMAAIGHPVAGDRLYGRGDPHIARQALHAWRLAFDHPLTGGRVTYTAALPDDLRAALDALGIRAALGVRAESN